jgi:DNA-binding CsgD family transcriptional regulator
MAAGLVDILEAAYQIETPMEPWMKGMAAAINSHLGFGLGVAALGYRIGDAGMLQPTAMIAEQLPPGALESFQKLLPSLPPDYIARTFAALPCDIASNSGPEQIRQITRETFRHWEQFGFRDCLTINGLDPTRHGVCFAVWLPKKQKRLSPPVRARWSRVAAHVAAANRLRARLAEPAEAIVTPSGKVEHAEDAAKSKDSRDELGQGAKNLDRARGKLRKSDPDRAVAEWKGLIAARWTLIDHFETDGRRYLLARRNEAAREGYIALSDRERQAIGFARLGHGNKLIAYEMGITPSTVAVLLHRASRKLGLRTRAELLSLR